jgi:hypothetical protein
VPKLTNLNALTVDDNDALTALPALSFSLEQVFAANLRIENNGALTRLSAIGATFLTIELVNNDSLGSLAGFNLSGIGFQLHIEDNDALPSLAGLQAPSLGELKLVGNDALTNLSGAPANLGALEIRDNPSLTSLAGATLPSSFWLINNDALVSLDGLSVGANAEIYHLRIEDNGALTSLAGLNNLSVVDQIFSIQNNPTLPQCAAQAFSARISGSGARTISGNNTTATCP